MMNKYGNNSDDVIPFRFYLNEIEDYETSPRLSMSHMGMADYADINLTLYDACEGYNCLGLNLFDLETGIRYQYIF